MGLRFLWNPIVILLLIISFYQRSMTQTTDVNSFSDAQDPDGHSLTSTSSLPSEATAATVPKSTLALNFAAYAILIFLNLLCYLRTVGAYYLADDFVHVAYLADVFNNHFYRLLENFTGNWMHAWGTQFYRPLISISLAIDYGLGSGDALPFHISNTVYHVLSSCFLFLFVRRLLCEFSPMRAYFAALFSAIFFAVCPLHTEVVSWVIGRVDGLCHVFFMASLYLFLRHKQDGVKWAQVLGPLAFAMSLMCKEMAATLPPLLVLLGFVASAQGSLTQLLKNSIKDSLSYWGVLLAYLGVRVLALGTFSGGYGGSVGEGLSNASWTERFRSASKIFMPFNGEIISPFDSLSKSLVSLYKASAVFLLLRTLLLPWQVRELKVIAFCIGWFVLSLLPTYSVFNISDSLMCSRFAYFATAPFCTFLAIILFPFWQAPKRSFLKTFEPWLARFSVALLVCFSLVFCGTTIKNNKPWADAGKQLRAFRAAVAGCFVAANPPEKIALLNIPHRLEGAHMIYNGAMLWVLLSEPLTKPSVADRVLNFEPPTYGDPELINVSRLRRIVKADKFPVKYWDADKKSLFELKLDPQPKEISFDLSTMNTLLGKQSGDSLNLESPKMDLNSAAADFVTCTLRFEKNESAKGFVTLYWSSRLYPSYSIKRSLSLAVNYDGLEHEYAFPVSERKAWIAGETINGLMLQVPNAAGSKVESVGKMNVLSARSIMPILEPQDMALGVDGIDRMSGTRFQIRCDARQIPACQSIRLELSKPNSWFEHYSGTLRDKTLSEQCLAKFTKVGQQAKFEFTRQDFPQSAYYELRAFALDKQGKPIGICSDPINLQID